MDHQPVAAEAGPAREGELAFGRDVCADALLVRNPDGRYEVDWESFESAIDERTKAFVLCNPHNPVGRVFTRAELERMASICLQRGLLIISDEIHGDLMMEGNRHIPIASLSPEVEARTITLMAPSNNDEKITRGVSFESMNMWAMAPGRP